MSKWYTTNQEWEWTGNGSMVCNKTTKIQYSLKNMRRSSGIYSEVKGWSQPAIKPSQIISQTDQEAKIGKMEQVGGERGEKTSKF